MAVQALHEDARRNPRTQEEARALVKHVESLFMPWNIDALVDGFTENCVVRFGTLGEFRGHEALRAFFTARSRRQKKYRLVKELRALTADTLTNTWTGAWEDAETGAAMKGLRCRGLDLARGQDRRVGGRLQCRACRPVDNYRGSVAIATSSSGIKADRDTLGRPPMPLSRRSVVAGVAGLALAPRLAKAAEQKTLRLVTRVIEVNGKPATRYGVSQPSGAWGLTLDEGDTFNVRLENHLDVLSGLHWHGLNPPWRQDGVPYISAPPVAPGTHVDYSFPAQPPGTRWMHSHFGLQEQDLLAGPLIIREASAIRSGAQEVVILLGDFSWTKPSMLFEQLRKPKPAMAMTGGGTTMASSGATDGTKLDLNDITYDAFLANDRTLADPEVFDVEKGAEVRLRIINGGSSTNFMVDLGAVEGTVVTVDGNPVVPLKVQQFPLAAAQRVDIMMRMPSDGKALPVLARGEGLRMQTGVVLRPHGGTVSKIPEMAETPASALTLMDEMKLRATQPYPSRPIDRSVPVDLTGNMAVYDWGLAVHGLGGAPATVTKGERVELVMRNTTMMAHPMHLHGPSFQVTEINGQAFPGAMRDTVLVPPRTTVKVIFDADNPGIWAFHCHNLYHLEAGMFTTVVYEGGFN
jgi:FtsP/CotA-like multicopper oxidase with cupredoxin domain